LDADPELRQWELDDESKSLAGLLTAAAECPRSGTIGDAGRSKSFAVVTCRLWFVPNARVPASRFSRRAREHPVHPVHPR